MSLAANIGLDGAGGCRSLVQAGAPAPAGAGERRCNQRNCASVRGGAAGPRTAFPTRWYRTQLPRESVRASQVVASAAPDQKPSLWSFFPAEEVALCNGALQWGCSGLPDLTALREF
eukprot:gene7805-1002_t